VIGACRSLPETLQESGLVTDAVDGIHSGDVLSNTTSVEPM
jgi:hypothetical protein